MKHFLGALLLTSSACLSCATSNLPKPHTPNPPELPPSSPAMAMIGRYGFAHACPVQGLIITAGHVASKITPTGVEIPQQYYYAQRQKRGTVVALMTATNRDLALLRLVAGDLPDFLEYGPTPIPGDEIHWWGYEYDPIRIKRYEGKVTGIVAGHLAFKPAPVPGSSGTCLLDTHGRVVGIVSWGYNYDKYGMGPMLPMPEEVQ